MGVVNVINILKLLNLFNICGCDVYAVVWAGVYMHLWRL